MKYRLQEIPSLVYNKVFADILRNRWYARQVDNNLCRAVNIKWLANHRKWFPWNNPQTLDEKIAWLQVNSDTSMWATLADKWEVKKYIEKNRGEVSSFLAMVSGTALKTLISRVCPMSL